MNRPYDKQDISHILEKFMAGESSLHEEQLLGEYFRTHEADDEWKEYKEMFALFDNGEVDIVPTADVPSLNVQAHAAHRSGPTFARWLAAAAAILAVLAVGTMLLVGSHETVRRPAATTKTFQKERQTAAIRTPAPQTKKPAPQTREPAPRRPCETTFAAVLPEVEFCPAPHEAQLPKVGRERTFGLVCQAVLPEITAYADSTVFPSSDDIMVACDEIEYNDKPFKNV